MRSKPNCWVFGELGAFYGGKSGYTVAVFATSAKDARQTVIAKYGSGKLISAQYPDQEEIKVNWAVVSEAKALSNRNRLAATQ